MVQRPHLPLVTEPEKFWQNGLAQSYAVLSTFFRAPQSDADERWRAFLTQKVPDAGIRDNMRQLT